MRSFGWAIVSRLVGQDRRTADVRPLHTGDLQQRKGMGEPFSILDAATITATVSGGTWRKPCLLPHN